MIDQLRGAIGRWQTAACQVNPRPHSSRRDKRQPIPFQNLGAQNQQKNEGRKGGGKCIRSLRNQFRI